MAECLYHVAVQLAKKLIKPSRDQKVSFFQAQIISLTGQRGNTVSISRR